MVIRLSLVVLYLGINLQNKKKGHCSASTDVAASATVCTRPPLVAHILFYSFQPPLPSRVHLPPPHLASARRAPPCSTTPRQPGTWFLRVASCTHAAAPARESGRPLLLNRCRSPPQLSPTRRRMPSPCLMRATPPRDAFSVSKAFSTAAGSLPTGHVLLPRRAPSPPPLGAFAWLFNRTRSGC